MKKTEDWHLFPLQPNTKKPYGNITDDNGRGGFYAATSNISKVLYWKKNFPGCNWALRTGSISKCFVVDVDVKNGAQGDKSIWDLFDKYGETPVTLTAKTPSGGIHYYFRMTKHVPSLTGVGKYGGIDIKSDGGYVVIPPSTIDGNPYEYTLEEEIAECPDWLYEELVAPNIKETNNKGFGHEGAKTINATEEEVKSFYEKVCVRLLEKYTSFAYKGERNKTLFEMICQIRDNGVPQVMAKEYALKFQAAMKDPDFTVEETLATLDSCYNHTPRKPSINISDLEKEEKAKELPELESFDQEGIARYITKNFHDRLKYIQEKGWAHYSNGYWDIDNGEQNALTLVAATLRALRIKYSDKEKSVKKLFECSHSNISSVMKFMQAYMRISISRYDAHPYLINCRESVLDLRTLEKYEHNSEYLFTYKLNVEFNPKSDNEAWIKFLKETLENPDLVESGVTQLELLQMSLGYSITGDSSEETMFYIFGETRSGKGTMMNTINKILGPLSGNVNTSVLSQSRYGSVDTQNFHLAKLKSCRYVVASETDKDTTFDAGKIKSITGNDPITCSYKFKDPFDYVPRYKIWVASNNEITLDTTDNAVWGRVRIFRFPYSKLDKADINLKSKLIEIADGVFTWICFGARAWYNLKMKGKRLPMTKSQEEYIKQRKEELDMVSLFINENGFSVPEVESDIDMLIPQMETYRRYTEFIKVNELGRPYSYRTFNQVMRGKGFYAKPTSFKGNKARCYAFKRELA